MIKALLLIITPGPAWERVAEAGRGLAIIFACYLVPMLLIVGVAEGFGLVHWGVAQMNSGLINKMTVNEAVIFEAARSLLMLVVIAVCAVSIKLLAETFHCRGHYLQAFTVVIYGLSPLFLVRSFSVFPVSLWLVWSIGVVLTLAILYHGVPCVMRTDPTHALGLYFMSSLVVLASTATERFFTAWYLSGHFEPLTNSVTQIAAKMPF
jgi:hypothetical protein